jgi:hypothetical protein
MVMPRAWERFEKFMKWKYKRKKVWMATKRGGA